MNKNNFENKMSYISILIVVGLLLSYFQQMAPSPLLGVLRDYYNIGNNDALLNLSISIMYPPIILASIGGGVIEQRVGTKNLFTLSMMFVAIGVLINYVSVNYTIFLIGRALYGIGFGLGIPFIGSAIMKWYTPKQRGRMNTINGLFPFVGAVMSFSLLVPMYTLFKKSWKHAIGISGFIIIIILALWIMIFHEKKTDDVKRNDENEVYEKNMYLNLWKRRTIKLLCITFICDFFCYSYMSVILPTFLLEIGNMTEASAGFWSAIAFPAMGIIGGMIGGVMIAKTGKRKPSMALGQILEVIGISFAALGSSVSVWCAIIGVAIFGLGNSIWMPGAYTVPMELEDMNSNRVGGAFALICSCGFAAGFISPIFGGLLTNMLMSISNINNPIQNHAFGLKWSMFLFGFINLIGFISITLMKETGPGIPKIKTHN